MSDDIDGLARAYANDVRASFRDGMAMGVMICLFVYAVIQFGGSML